MQQEAKKDLAKKQEQFKAIAHIADKLDSSEAYKTAFNEELKAEAIRVVNEEQYSVELGNFTETYHNIIKGYQTNRLDDKKTISTELIQPETVKSDIQTVKEALSKDFEINEKSKRSEDYKTAFNTSLSEEMPQQKTWYTQFINNIKTTLSNISDIELREKKFDKEHQRFPKFIIDPIAKNDMNRYKETQDPYIAFEINRKMQKSDYLKSIQEIYKAEAPSPHLAENYANSKINSIKDTVNGLSEEQKTEFSERFKREYPNGFKTTNEQEAENLAEIIKSEQEIKNTENRFIDNLTNYLRTEQGNENEQYKRLQYFQQEMIDNPDNFQRFTERFFTDGNIRSTLPPDIQAKLDRIGSRLNKDGNANKAGAKSFSQSLQNKVLKETKSLSQQVGKGNLSVKAKEQLKMYYARQFKKEYGTAEKKLQMKRQLEQRNKISNPKLSH